jgi:RND family efflux transporter MFP subunit
MNVFWRHLSRISLFVHGRPVAGALVAGLLALPLAACEPGNSQDAREVKLVDRPVLVAPVHYQDQVEARTFAATIRPRIESDLGFRVGGKVAQRLVQNGDRVQKGQPLLTLDTNDLELQVQQADAEVRAAKINVLQAEGDERRAIELQAKGWTAAAAVEKARAAAEEARGRQTRAQRSLDLARNSLGYATLAADADGVITATLAEPGQVVAAGQAVARLAHLGEMEALVALPETFVERAREATGSLTLWSLPGRSYEAKLRELASAADAATRTYAARYAIPNADDAVRLGMSATLSLRETAGARAARLPLTALFNHGEGPMVWVVDGNGRLSARSVAVTRYDGNNVLIAGGPAEGEKVVTLGVEKLDPGLVVRPVASLVF